jgi:uncharacterized protein (DUF1697 family)
MTSYVALLRGINVGGTGLLPMQDLSRLCTECGLLSVRTYIQSGNVVFASAAAEKSIQAKLQKALAAKMGKPIHVMVRNAQEMRDVLAGNPFPDREPSKVAVAFLAEAPAGDLLQRMAAPGGEQVRIGRREIYIYYPDGMGQSKLKLTFAGPATVRNINTVTKLVSMMTPEIR